MFNIFKKKSQVSLYSPVIGQSISIEDVEDEMFSKKLLGEGIAFVFDEGLIYSPCDAKISMIASTKHAIGFEAKNIEFLIHIGLDTVNFEGKGFEIMVSEGSHVSQGQLIAKVDKKFFTDKGINLVTPLVVMSDNTKISYLKIGKVKLDDEVMVVDKE